MGLKKNPHDVTGLTGGKLSAETMDTLDVPLHFKHTFGASEGSTSCLSRLVLTNKDANQLVPIW